MEILLFALNAHRDLCKSMKVIKKHSKVSSAIAVRIVLAYRELAIDLRANGDRKQREDTFLCFARMYHDERMYQLVELQTFQCVRERNKMNNFDEALRNQT